MDAFLLGCRGLYASQSQFVKCISLFLGLFASALLVMSILALTKLTVKFIIHGVMSLRTFLS